MTENQILLESFLQALAAAALVGRIYCPICVGLAMISGTMRVKARKLPSSVGMILLLWLLSTRSRLDKALRVVK